MFVCKQIFFPILQSDHWYLVCFNLLKPAISIIDNAKPAGKDTVIGKYGDIPAKLVCINSAYSV